MFIITGNACSGTGYMSKLFTELGYRCGHEKYFSYPKRDHLGQFSNDSSWLAMPYIYLNKNSHKNIIHIFRNPLDNLRSVIHARFLNKEGRVYPHKAFVREHRPDILEYDNLLDRAIAYVGTWDNCLFLRDNLRNHRAYNVENQDPEVLADIVSFATDTKVHSSYVESALKNTSRKINAHKKDDNVYNEIITWDLVMSRPGGKEMRDRAEFFGYV